MNLGISKEFARKFVSNIQENKQELLLPPLQYKPTPKQEIFHNTRDQGIDQVLFGGAAGGGKSHSLVWDCFEHCLKYPGAKAILLRRTFPELLSSIISKFLEEIPKEYYRFSNVEKIAYIYNGSQIRFSYLERDQDKYRYQGAEFSYIGIDEATHIVPSSLKYMLSRLRNPDNIPNFFRATANPDGRYMESIKALFVDVANENEVYTDEYDITKIYIPSKLTDNPYLNDDYRKQLEQLPPRERQALLEGKWDLVPQEGAAYAKQLLDLKDQGHLTTLEIERNLDVHTAWDLGISDSTAIWLYQIYGYEIRIIGYYENNNVGMDHYINFLHELKESFGINYGKHYAPHDIAVRELTTGKRRIDTAREMGIIFSTVENKRIVEGVEAARRLLPNCYFDVNRCKLGLKSLRNYHREYDPKLDRFKDTYVHDWSSHAADAFRYLAVSVINIGTPEQRKIWQQFTKGNLNAA